MNQFVWKNRQNLRSHIRDNETNFARINIELFAQFITEFRKLSDKLNASKTSTYYNEGQFLATFSRVVFLSGFSEFIANLFLQTNSIFIRPKSKCIFFSTRDAEESRLTTCADNKVVIFVGFGFRTKLVVSKINAIDGIEDNINLLTGKNLFKLDFD
ncbi:hypothetical protein D3C76_965200 [compost metagenome]